MACSAQGMHAEPATLNSPEPEALIFSQTVESLFRALGPLDESARQRFVALGVDPLKPLDPAYPVEQWLDIMRVGAEVFAPGLAFSEALQLLAHRFVDAYSLTLVGKAMLVGMRLLGPRRTLERLARNLKTGSTFFQTKVEPLGGNAFALWINRVTWPAWYFGLIERGLFHAGAREISVSLMTHDGPGRGATFLIKWA